MNRHDREAGGKDRMMNLYQRFMDSRVMHAYYEHSNFNNVGLWEGHIRTQKEACLHLMETLAATIRDKKGRLLDIACGTGGTTSFLASHFDPAGISGINISAHQVAQCRLNYPHLNFMEMNATALQFPENSVDIVFCAEAAFHFNTRVDFIRECSRVLKKDGQLVLCDILLDADESLQWFIPAANNQRTIRDYEDLLSSNKFGKISVTDKTSATCAPYAANLRKWAMSQYFLQKISGDDYHYLISLADLIKKYPINHYLFITASKQ